MSGGCCRPANRAPTAEPGERPSNYGDGVARPFRLQPPSLHGPMVARSRLAARLAERWDRRLVTIVAGPGFGKTVQLTAAMSDGSHPARARDVWLSCDARDDDAEHLTAGLYAACGLPAGDDLDNIVDWVWAQAPSPVCFLFDDVQEIGAGSGGASVLGRLVDDLPNNGHVVLASRRAGSATARPSGGEQAADQDHRGGPPLRRRRDRNLRQRPRRRSEAARRPPVAGRHWPSSPRRPVPTWSSTTCGRSSSPASAMSECATSPASRSSGEATTRWPRPSPAEPCGSTSSWRTLPMVERADYGLGGAARTLAPGAAPRRRPCRRRRRSPPGGRGPPAEGTGERGRGPPRRSRGLDRRPGRGAGGGHRPGAPHRVGRFRTLVAGPSPRVARPAGGRPRRRSRAPDESTPGGGGSLRRGRERVPGRGRRPRGTCRDGPGGLGPVVGQRREPGSSRSTSE